MACEPSSLAFLTSFLSAPFCPVSHKFPVDSLLLSLLSFLSFSFILAIFTAEMDLSPIPLCAFLRMHELIRSFPYHFFLLDQIRISWRAESFSDHFVRLDNNYKCPLIDFMRPFPNRIHLFAVARAHHDLFCISGVSADRF